MNQMTLPFTPGQFLDTLAAYNNSFWPVALALWIATVAAFVSRLTGYRRGDWAFGVLAVQWAWSAIAYHATLFARINPAAWLFAGLFFFEAALLMWHGVVQNRLPLSSRGLTSRLLGYGLILYGLMYPLIAMLGGHAYPRVPTFGLPCPITIVTIGFQMLVPGRLPLSITVVPLLWSVVGGSAALLLGVRADLALPVAGLVLAARLSMSARRRQSGRSKQSSRGVPRERGTRAGVGFAR
jgi:hypothetical protein